MAEPDVPTPDGLDPEEHPVIDLTDDTIVDLSAPPGASEDETAPSADVGAAAAERADALDLLMEDSLATWSAP